MRKKFKLKSYKSAYLQLDFAFAVLVFFFFIFITYGFYLDFKTSNENSLEIIELEGVSRDLCAMLVLTPGNPIDWENNVSGMNYVGLKKSAGKSLDLNKLNLMNSTNYFIILDNINISDYVFVSVDSLISNNNYLEFGKSATYGTKLSTYSCYSSLENETVRVLVEVWK